MKRIVLIICAIAAVSIAANAQFRIDKSYPTAGTTVEIDAENALKSIIIDFNTDLAGGVEGGTLVRAQGQRGVKVEVYNELGAVVQPPNNDSRFNNYGSNGNYLLANNVAGIIGYYSSETVWSEDNKFYLPSNTILLVNPEDEPVALADRAFGVYPGMYKAYKVWYYFNFDGLSLTSDLSFEIFTLDAGNTGKQAVYNLKMGIGSDEEQYTAEAVYTSGEEKKTINVAEAFGLEISDIVGKKIYLMLTTDGTGEAINPFKYDPVVVVDNFTVQATVPFWITPDAGVDTTYGQPEGGVGVKGNSETPAEALDVTEGVATYALDLKMKNHIKDLKVTLDEGEINDLAKLQIRLKGAQRLVGTEWVDIEGVTLTPPSEPGSSGNYGKESLTIPVAGDGAEDEIRILIIRAAKDGDVNGTVVNNTLEMDNGTRIWYEFYATVTDGTNLTTVNPLDVNIYAGQGKVFVTNANEEVVVYNVSGQKVKSVSNAAASKGITLNQGVYVVSTGNVTKKVVLK